MAATSDAVEAAAEAGQASQLVIRDQRNPRPNQYAQPPSYQPQQKSRPVGIVRMVYNSPVNSGAYDYSYETENGIKQEAVGTMKKYGDSEVLVMRGSYSYVGPDGLTYEVNWVADENGYRASGAHLPKAVEIPFPEQRAAVAAQIKYAQEEDRQRAARSKEAAAVVVKKL